MNLKLFTIVTLLSGIWSNVTLIPLKAQTPSKIPTVIPANVDDLPTDPDQLKTWYCS
ncbi:MAG: hypothetical protein GW795_07835, partial [Cyanobacteria bacterium]|nr:hypothetical protein [Cyanobacteria bacterium CG_2015-04_32_10]